MTPTSFLEQVAGIEADIIAQRSNPDRKPVPIAQLDQLTAAAAEARSVIDSTLGHADRWQQQTAGEISPRARAFVAAAIRGDGMMACPHYGQARPFVADMMRRIVACDKCLAYAATYPPLCPTELCSFCLTNEATQAVGLRVGPVYVEGSACQECGEIHASVVGGAS